MALSSAKHYEPVGQKWMFLTLSGRYKEETGHITARIRGRYLILRTWFKKN